MTPKPYTYRATFTSNYDGDTVRVVLDLGMSIEFRAVCRLYGIDTPGWRDRRGASTISSSMRGWPRSTTEVPSPLGAELDMYSRCKYNS
jgi:hypothetical protein